MECSRYLDGMGLRSWSQEVVSSLRLADKGVLLQRLPLDHALAELAAMEPSGALQIFINSLRASERGITR